MRLIALSFGLARPHSKSRYEKDVGNAGHGWSDRGNTLDAVARGAGGGTGIAFVEVYDLDRGERSGPCSRATPSGTLPLAIPIFLAQGLTDNVVLPQVTLAYRRSDAGRAAPCSFTLCRVSDIPSPPAGARASRSVGWQTALPGNRHRIIARSEAISTLLQMNSVTE